MFKSIQYKLTLLTFLLVAEVAAATWFVLTGRYVHAAVCGVAVAATILALHRHYRRFNQNLVFLLNTLDNGDYSFHFSEGRFSAREKEFNATLNRIKDVLANARKEVVENEKFLSLIIESVSTGVLILDDRGVVQRSNHSAQALFGLPVFTHVNQLRAVDEHLPDLFQGLQPGDNVQIAVPNEREVQQINLSVSHIRLKRGLMRVFTLNNIGNALENKETESWIRLIRVLTHEIMNSIAPVSSLSETLLSLYRDADNSPEQLRANTIEAFETIQTTASGLLTFVESYRQFTSIPRPRKERIEGRELIEQLVKLHEPALHQGGIALTWQAGEDAHLMADRNLLMRVLVNLLKNAMEAPYPTADKRIRIRLEAKADGSATIDVDASLEANMKGLELTTDDYSGAIDGVEMNGFGIGGYGVGIDLGATYRLLNNLTLSAAVTDLGFISWSKSSSSVVEGDNTQTYDASNMDQFMDRVDGGEVIDFDMFGLHKGNVQKKRSTRLPTTLAVGAEYAFWKNRFSVGGLYTSRWGMNRTLSEVTLSANFRPTTKIGLSASYSMLQSAGKTFGAAIKLGPLTLGTDYLFLGKNTRSVNVFLGLSRTIGKKRPEVD